MATTPHARSTPVRRPAREGRSPVPDATRPSLYDRLLPAEPANEALPGEDEAWAAVAPLRPDTPHVRARRFLDGLGDLLAALVLVVGGIAAVGLASLF